MIAGRRCVKHVFAVALFVVFWARVGLAQDGTTPVRHTPVHPTILAPVMVPEVRGSTEQDARKTLSDHGLTPGQTIQSVGPGAVGTVWRTTPVAGTIVHRGTVV